MSEHNEQCNLIDWATRNECRYPELKNIFAVPNGGLRNKRVGVKTKMEGLKAGVPDLFLACAKLPEDFQDTFEQKTYTDKKGNVSPYWKLSGGVYFGLFIEMKFGSNTTSKQQKEWIRKLRDKHYKCVVCYSWQDARDIILEYIEADLSLLYQDFGCDYYGTSKGMYNGESLYEIGTYYSERENDYVGTS